MRAPIILGLALALGLFASNAMAYKQHGHGFQIPTLPPIMNLGQTVSVTTPFHFVAPPTSANFDPSTAFCSTPILAVAETTRCNGFREGEHCLLPVHRVPLNLIPDEPPAPPVAPFVAPPAAVDPENG